jgi:glycosyltransferase involved in cell wall biosynthesis
MRILLALGLSAGGVGRHVHGLAAGLVAAGHEVVVAAPASAEETFGFAATGARVETVEVSDRPDPRLDLRAVRGLRRLARGAGVVHAHGVRAGGLTSLATAGTGVPVVVTLHNAAPTGRVASAVHALLERIVARRAALVLGVSTDLVTRMGDLGSRRTGLAVVAAPPPPAVGRSRAEVRRELGLSDETRLAVSVGRLAEQKNFGLLLDAVDRLRDLDVLLAVAGEGPERGPLEGRIAGDRLPVRLLGRRPDVPDLLAAADVVVSSADWEGQPVWLQEALLVGAPLVVTDAGGTVATIRGAAEVVPLGDAAALAAGIRAVLTDPAEGERLRGLSRAAAAALPTEADAVAAALDGYASVLGG